MENQHKLITGYPDLTQDEISKINRIKEEGQILGNIILVMKTNKNIDQRWLSIAETHIQQGVMAAVRAITKPEGF